ncbi:hypothetical protein [Streptomyces sp. NPDC003077]|uniref:hypothetical protein n=1 Tax=Streptomyces sp. NPDC003077 TaxID=3154443 RepID=UPI0033BD917B
MSSMRVFLAGSERPPRLNMFVAAVAAGYAAGVGNEAAKAVGCLAAVAVMWLWERWSC